MEFYIFYELNTNCIIKTLIIKNIFFKNLTFFTSIFLLTKIFLHFENLKN